MIVRQKHYSAILDMGVDFADRLATGETLSSSPALTVLSASSGSTSDVTIASVAINGTQVQGRVSGGRAYTQVQAGEPLWRTRYTIRASVVTSSGETESDVVELVVYDSVERTS